MKHPHGRGEDLTSEERQLLELGNTPTGVGKTLQSRLCCLRMWKHPHGRGEDEKDPVEVLMHAETPPRAWGRRRSPQDRDRNDGNTPTGVGKTSRHCYGLVSK